MGTTILVVGIEELVIVIVEVKVVNIIIIEVAITIAKGVLPCITTRVTSWGMQFQNASTYLKLQASKLKACQKTLETPIQQFFC